jgi:hypothetical protein
MRHYAFGFANSLQNVSGGSREQMFRDGIPFSEPKIKRGVDHKKRDRLPFYNDHSFVVLAEREKRVGFWGAHGPRKLRQMQLVILSERQRYKKR